MSLSVRMRGRGGAVGLTAGALYECVHWLSDEWVNGEREGAEQHSVLGHQRPYLQRPWRVMAAKGLTFTTKRDGCECKCEGRGAWMTRQGERWLRGPRQVCERDSL
eukprot:357992-Chlamydomonas_euryale.AAC.1